MTHDEMAAELRKAGWRIEPPLTQENCKHINTRGYSAQGCDGSSSSETYCLDCGATWGHKTPPDPNYRPAILHN